ncbi:MAG: hypothetical protein DRQ39_05325 [Gammaproteobacteria bacterium]|nr:MAG: hypothetical protein DRQ39_05325 [Gammaproteobacteria bacterium]
MYIKLTIEDCSLEVTDTETDGRSLTFRYGDQCERATELLTHCAMEIINMHAQQVQGGIRNESGN